MILRPKIGDAARRGSAGLAVVAVALCLLFSLVPASLAAQQGDDESSAVKAILPEPSVEAGETTQYQISVNDAREDAPPPAPTVDGLSITYTGPSHQFALNIINGQMVRRNTTIYTYVVRTSKAGRFTIPASTVQVNGVAQTTQPLVLTVEEAGAPAAPPPGQTVTAELIVPKKTAYVGESFLAELRVYFGLNVNILAYDEAPQLGGEGFSAQRFTQPRGGVPVINGVRYRGAVYRTAVTAAKTGPLAIGPMETTPTVQIPSPQKRRQHRGGGLFGDDDDDFPFNNPFSNGMMQRMTPPQQLKVTAPAVPVEILPLPDGKPEAFSGGIGQFKLAAEAIPRHAQTGDPVTVRLILTGQGNFPRVNAPVPTDEHGLRTYPPTARFKADDDVGLSGTKTFEQVVVAEGPRDSLPSFRFAYLDPATGEYVTLDSGPLPVKIEGSVVPPPTISNAPTATASGTPAATPTPPPAPAQDILYIRNDPGTVRGRAAFLPVYRRPLFWWAQSIPLAGLLAVGGILALRARARNETLRRLAARQRQQGELHRALRGETTSRRDFYTAATRLAQLRAGRQGGGSLTAAEIAGQQGLDPQTANSVQEIFQRHDELAYSGGEVAREPVSADERQTVLAALESLGKNAR